MTSMQNLQRETDILIVGAGLAGLTAASQLQLAGRAVLVVDKGRGVGGRLASRRIGQATFDHGAQFMTARDPRFAASVEQWRKLGLVEEWYRSMDGQTDGHPRWRGRPSMTAIAKSLASDLDALLATQIVAVSRVQNGWRTDLECGDQILARALILTPPVPQSLALLAAGASELPADIMARLQAIEYERCLAVMAVLDGPTRIPPPGALAPTDGPIAWITDNQMKGISALPAVTIHATAAFSLEHWDDDRQQSGRLLLGAAEPWLGSTVIDFQVHGWRYSKPLRVEGTPCLIAQQSPPLVFAGDAFGGPRVEGAALSGWAAADALK